MNTDLPDGAVLQRDRRTYAIAPRLACGLVGPDMLRRLADVAERFGATLKCTGAQRIAVIGLRAEDLDEAWNMLGGKDPGHMHGNRVRSVRACPGTQFCKRALQDSLDLGLELDRLYLGMPLPGKLKIGVSGCGNECSETCIRDIGIVGERRGWHILVGGAGGMSPRLARQLTESPIDREQVLRTVARLIDLYREQARPDERIGSVIDRLGLTAVRERTLGQG